MVVKEPQSANASSPIVVTVLQICFDGVLARPADKDVVGYDLGACVAHNSPLLTITT